MIQVHGNHLIEAEITTEGPYLGQRVFIPRIPLTNSDGRGVPFKRVQFPAKVAFAITINRSQGQTFDHLGCDFVKPPFTHGQLYVAVTRVRNPHNLRLRLPESEVLNPVFQEVLIARE